MPTSDTPPDDRWRRLAAALTAILALGCARPAPDGAPPATPPDALASWTAAEVPRLREVAGGLGEAGREILAELHGAAAEAAAGRHLQATWRLAAARADAEARRFVAARGGVVKEAADLDREVAAVAGDPPPAKAGAGERSPAVVVAFADTLRHRAAGHQASAAAYGRASSLEAGLYYLGRAVSDRATAAELEGLGPAARPAAPADPGRLAAALDQIDERTVAAYRRPGAETERHGPFIALNSRIKEGRGLLREGRLEAAELAALDALRRLAELEDETPPPDPEALRASARTWRQRLDGAPWDASLGRFFVETAQSALAAGSPGAADLRRARAALEVTLPRYLTLSEDRS